MYNNEKLIIEFGLEIAREKITKKVSQLMNKKDAKGFKVEIGKLIRDYNEVEKGNSEIIKKYMER